MVSCKYLGFFAVPTTFGAIFSGIAPEVVDNWVTVRKLVLVAQPVVLQIDIARLLAIQRQVSFQPSFSESPFDHLCSKDKYEIRVVSFHIRFLSRSGQKAVVKNEQERPARDSRLNIDYI